MTQLICLFATVALAAAVSAADQAPADPKTLMTERGKLLFGDDLAAAPTKEWKSAKGKWEAADGSLKGSEVKADMHAAVTRHSMGFRNAVIQFSFRIDGAKRTALSVNGAKGHVCRVSIDSTGLAVQKDSFDKGVTDKAVMLQRVAAVIKPGEWHTVLVEILGKEMLARIDDAHTAFGANDGIDVDKANFGFTVSGESVSFKNLRVWEALPNKDWDAAKAKLTAAREKTAAK